MPDVPKVPKEKMEKTAVTKKFETFELTGEEKKLIRKIGEDNLDYCILSLLKGRFPEYEFDYSEDEEKLRVKKNGEEIEFDFSREYFEPIYNAEDETLVGWISKTLMVHKALLSTQLP